MEKLSKSARSKVMASVRGRGNKSTEIKAMRLFRTAGITGWRRHIPVFGRPDFAFSRSKLAVFIDGCFWHGCPRCYRAPKSSEEYWTAKVARNKKRDKLVTKQLRGKGWKVIRVWECQLKSPDSFLQKIINFVGSVGSKI